jgi:tellurite resistance protein TerC
VDYLQIEWLSQPAWMGLGILAIIGVLLAFALGALHSEQHEIGVCESLLLPAAYFSLGVGFGGLVWRQPGNTAGVKQLLAAGIAYSLWRTRVPSSTA